MKAFWKRRSKPKPLHRPPAESESADSTVSQFLTGETLYDRATVEKLMKELAEISERVASGRQEDLRELLVNVVDASIKRTRAGRGLLIMEEGAGRLRVDVARRYTAENLEDRPVFSRSVVRRVLDSGSGICDSFHPEDEAPRFTASAHDLRLRSLMCVPFVTGGGREESQRGVLYVDSQKLMFDERDLSYFSALSQQVAVVLEFARLHVDSLERVRLEQALELASAVQRGFMSQVGCEVEGFEVHGVYQPAEKASGDFYNCMCMGSGTTVAMLGDATGHGVGPALVASSVQGSLRSLLGVLKDPALALTTLNQDLAGRLESGFFITLCLIQIQSDETIRVLNAGHPDPLVWESRTGRVRRIDSGSTPALGIVPDFPYVASAPIRLQDGDALITFTDGLSEARSALDHRFLFGTDRLRQALASAAPGATSARSLAEAICERVLEFAGGKREDDMTILAVQRRSQGSVLAEEHARVAGTGADHPDLDH